MSKFKRAVKKLRKKVLKPWVRILLMRLIVLYQRTLSRHTCMYEPTCSEYTLRCLNNHGVLLGIIMGMWRILRCNPWTKGGYDPAPENYFKVRWVY